MFNLFGNKKEAKLFPEITGDTIVGDVLDMDETTAPYFQEIGMHCLGCPASRGETIAEACAVAFALTQKRREFRRKVDTL